MLVGVGQSGALDGLGAEVIVAMPARVKRRLGLTQRATTAQVGKHHGHELMPSAKALAALVGLVGVDSALKTQPTQGFDYLTDECIVAHVAVSCFACPKRLLYREKAGGATLSRGWGNLSWTVVPANAEGMLLGAGMTGLGDGTGQKVSPKFKLP